MNKKSLIVLFILSLIVSACGSPSAAEIEMVSTAAAQTVEARFTQMTESTSTPEPSGTEKETLPTLTATPSETPISEVAPEGCLEANFVGETMPDGTIVETGQYFTKSWSIRNDGTCTWHTGYKLVYWSGEILGGSAEYQFFEDIAPGETMTFPIQLLAPDEARNYEGFWKIKSPSGYIFGIGESNAPVSVNIDVREADDIEYGITSVEYYMTRDPEQGCPANVSRTIYAVVSVSGPMEIKYQFYQRQSDGEIVKQTKKWLIFTEAGTQTISNVWILNQYTTPNPRYVSLVILNPDTNAPVHQYPEFVFVNDCPDQSP